MTLNLIKVSVCCITYNHAAYIKDAINGFLMQKTTFPIEVIIHDDASNDGTAEIIKNYAEKYPHLILPIFQSENQYSKNQGGIFVRFVWPSARGKYIAICEGDDYWSDPFKLQKQIDELEKHPEINICFHPAIILNEISQEKVGIMCKYGDSNKILSAREVIINDGKMPTPSLVIKRKAIENIPDWFYKAPVKDYFLQILGSLDGGALYLYEAMAVYRKGVKGSWSEKMNAASFKVDLFLQMFDSIEFANIYTKKKYEKEFSIVKNLMTKRILTDRVIPIKTRRGIYNHHSNQINLKDKILWKSVYQYVYMHKLLSRCRKLITYLFPKLKLGDN
jgi:glycosyltransferase involved in cell wall biosynthesis